MAKLNINGKVIDVQAEADTPLLWVIREQAGLTGTKYGCGVAACGACTVHINGEVQRSCSLPLSAVKASAPPPTRSRSAPPPPRPARSRSASRRHSSVKQALTTARRTNTTQPN